MLCAGVDVGLDGEGAFVLAGGDTFLVEGVGAEFVDGVEGGVTLLGLGGCGQGSGDAEKES